MFLTNQFIFLHMPKTGGTFIEDFLQRRWPKGDVLPRDCPQGLHTRHLSIGDIPARYHSRSVWMGVRNPWRWYVSWYEYLKVDHFNNVTTPTHRFQLLSQGTDMSFKQVLRRALFFSNELAEHYLQLPNPHCPNEQVFGHARRLRLGWYGYRFCRIALPNYKELLPSISPDELRGSFERNSAVNHYIRTERLTKDLLAALRSVGHRYPPSFKNRLERMPHVKAQNYKDWRSYYDDESIEWVAKREDLIIRKFGYEFR